MQSSGIKSFVLVLIFDLVSHDELSVVDLFDYGVDLLAGWRDSVLLASGCDDIEQEVCELVHAEFLVLDHVFFLAFEALVFLDQFASSKQAGNG